MPVNTEIGKYRETGHCLIPSHAGPEIMDGIREDVLKAIEARNRKLAKQASKTKYYREWAFGLHESSERVADYLRGGPFPGLVASVLGGDADLQFTSTMTKTLEMASALDWHQDAVYDKAPDHVKFSFWIAITDSRRDNGCLRIIPGSHAQGPVAHIPSRNFPPDKEIDGLDEAKAVDVEMEPGEILMLDPHIIHSSRPNGSGRLRMGLIAGFMLPKAEYLDFERITGFRYLRGYQPRWSRLSAPE